MVQRQNLKPKLIIAKNLKYISEKTFTSLTQNLEEIMKILGTLVRKMT